MRLVGLLQLEEFAARHGDVRPQINAWVRELEGASWRSPQDVKARYAGASFLSDNRVIFNLKGNSYRLEVKVSYESQVVLIKRIGTHAEYSKWKF
jgi:mRNA interferase HigB